MYTHSLLLPDGTILSSGRDRLPVLQRVSLTQKVNTEQDLTCGSVFASMLEVTLLCQDSQMPVKAGDRVELFRNEDGQTVPQGIFYVENPTKTAKGIYKITAYDTMRTLDKDLSLWLSGLSNWPFRMQDLAQMVCEYCGVELVESDIPNGHFLVNAFSGEEITGRMLMGWIAQAAGKFCRATIDGRIEFAWYSPTDTVLMLTGENYYYMGSFSREEYQVKPIDQVVLRADSSDVGTMYPTDVAGENVYVVEGNPLLSAENGQSLQEIAQSIYERLQAVTYTPCSITVPGSLNISPGQILQIQDSFGKYHTMYVMERRRTAGKDVLSCTGSYQRDRTTVANRTSLKALSGKVLHLRMDVDGIFAENKNTSGMLSKIEMDVNGIRTQVLQQQEETTGIKTQFSKLEQDGQKLDVRISQIEENGTNKVETSTGYRFDEDGLWISKSGDEMENQLDNTGMYVRRSGKTILQANTQGVEAVDVTVRNYLTVGNFARLEDYSNGTDQMRTACFWIGDAYGTV